MHFLTFKFFFAVLPLMILGYILGALVIASYHDWHFSPVFFLLDALGILIALYNIREKYLMG